MTEKTNSNSPVLLLGISESYLRAFEILWTTEFEGKNRFYWDKNLIIHPISQLIGVALETSIKGLLICRGQKTKRSHNLANLFEQLDDEDLLEKIKNKLSEVPVPHGLYDQNPDVSRNEVQICYRLPSTQVALLNEVYDRPFASRYPVLGVHSLPAPKAIQYIIEVMLNQLLKESRRWNGPKSK